MDATDAEREQLAAAQYKIEAANAAVEELLGARNDLVRRLYAGGKGVGATHQARALTEGRERYDAEHPERTPPRRAAFARQLIHRIVGIDGTGRSR